MKYAVLTFVFVLFVAPVSYASETFSGCLNCSPLPAFGYASGQTCVSAQDGEWGEGTFCHTWWDSHIFLHSSCNVAGGACYYTEVDGGGGGQPGGVFDRDAGDGGGCGYQDGYYCPPECSMCN